jgi:hypothetical protein
MQAKLILILLLQILAFNEPKVYICKSGTSYAYHNKICPGLRKCTHQILYVTINEAIASGHKKPCGYCYK